MTSEPEPGGGVVTAVVKLDWLLNSFSSSIAFVGSTTAEFVIDPGAAGAIPVIVIVAFAPAFTRPPVQFTTGSATEQVKRLVVEIVIGPVTPAGRVSTTRTLFAFAPPWLFTTSV